MPRTAQAQSAARRDGILEAATVVFLRYGFKKTSMDDLARAAGLSRQGLYLHFDTKEALFKAALHGLVSESRAALRAALARDDLGVEERLVGAFEALHGQAFGAASSEHMNELLEAATSLTGPLVAELEQELTAGVVRILASSGVSAAWKAVGVSARELAENLSGTSVGVKHSVKTLAAYRARMRTAVKIVARGAHK